MNPKRFTLRFLPFSHWFYRLNAFTMKYIFLYRLNGFAYGTRFEKFSIPIEDGLD